MEPKIVITMLLSFSMVILQLEASKVPIVPHISVMGMVFCDTCSNNSFNTHMYLLSGAEVRIDCRFMAVSPRTAEQISFSVNRTTNQYGVYRHDLTSVDGIYCAREAAVLNTCRATLIKSGSPTCNEPGFIATSDEFSLKSERTNECIYSMFPLSFRASKKDLSICGK